MLYDFPPHAHVASAPIFVELKPRGFFAIFVPPRKMQNKWAMEFLKVDLRFQESEELKRMVAAIVREYEAKKKAS